MMDRSYWLVPDDAPGASEASRAYNRGYADGLTASQPEQTDAPVPEDVREWMTVVDEYFNSNDCDVPDNVLTNLQSIMDYLDGLPVAPEPDWSVAPERAEYYAVDADRISWWFILEPFIRSKADAGWSMLDETKGFWFAGRRKLLPIGCDWRETLTKRPESV